MSLPDVVVIDGVEYTKTGVMATRLGTHVMYDCHLFRSLKGTTVDALIEDWERECASPDPHYGRPSLCPVIVLDGKNELRRVGKMVFPASEYRPREKVISDVAEFRRALKADPDISRLLAQRAAVTVTPERSERK